MYLEYFDLNEKPYSYLIPDSRFFYFTPQSRSIKNQCDYIVSEKSGHLFISGPIGAGKTTLLRTITTNLMADGSNQVEFINAPNLKTSNALMRRIAEAYKIPTSPKYDVTLQNFTDWLLKTDKLPILIIDEGQNLVRDSLKLIHYLMTYVSDRLLIMVILCGQEEMVDRINKYREIRSRMFPASLAALTIDDADEMLRYRWKTASKNEANPFPFTKEAVNYIFNASKGIPRSICQIADMTLLAAYNGDKKEVSGDLAKLVINRLFTEKELEAQEKESKKEGNK